VPNYTENYNLKKPLGTESFNIEDQNGNMEIIDEALKANEDAIASKETPAGAQAKVDVHINTVDPHTEYIRKSLATAVNDFIVASGAGVFVKKTLAEIKTILGLGSAAYTASTAYATAAQGTKADNAATQASLDTHTADYVRQPGYGVTAGGANTYTLTPNPAIVAYAAGMCFAIKIHAANTGVATLNVNAKGAKAIQDSKGYAMTAGKLRLNGVYTLRYDGTNFILQGEGGEYGTAGAAQTLTGYTVGTDSGVVAGTLTEIPLTAGETLIAQTGEILIFSSTSTNPMSNTVYAKKSEIEVNRNGTIRVKFNLRTNGGIATARVYKNGIAIGTERVYSSGGASPTYTEDFTIADGDLIQLYAKTSDGTDSYAAQWGDMFIFVTETLAAKTII
jgi:hypothetical protein